MNLNFLDHFSKSWRASFACFSLLLFVIVFAFKSTFFGMVSIWYRSETFTHGFLVFPIVAWLVWQKRYLLLSKTPRINIWFLGFGFCASFVWLLGDLVFINSVTQLAVIALIVLAVFAIFGINVASVILFPLLFLFFAVPLGEFLLPILMEWTAKFTVVAIRLSGIPVYQDGLHFVISSGNWSVVEACSGVRYLISSFMIGTLYAYLNYRSFKRRLIFICVAVLVPILANWARAYFIVMLGHFSGNTLAVGFDHIIYGWAFFGVVIALMFLIGSRWAEDSTEDELDSAISVVPSNSTIVQFPLMALIFSTAIIIPVFWTSLFAEEKSLSEPVLVAPLKFNSGWSVSPEKLVDFKSGFKFPSVEMRETYELSGSRVGVYVAYYRGQNYDKKLISSDNYLIHSDEKKWSKSLRTEDSVDLNNKSVSIQLERWRNTSAGDVHSKTGLVSWKIYWVNGVFTDNDFLAKIYGALQRLLGRGDDAAAIVIYAEDDDAAKLSLQKFLKENYFEIQSMLDATSVK